MKILKKETDLEKSRFHDVYINHLVLEFVEFGNWKGSCLSVCLFVCQDFKRLIYCTYVVKQFVCLSPVYKRLISCPNVVNNFSVCLYARLSVKFMRGRFLELT